MSAMAHDHTTDPDDASQRPRLAIVPDERTLDSHAEAVAADSRTLRAAAIGGVIGFVVLTAVIWLIGTAAGLEASSALGLGAFVGAWGGAGFGFMMGATITISRHATDHA